MKAACLLPLALVLMFASFTSAQTISINDAQATADGNLDLTVTSGSTGGKTYVLMIELWQGEARLVREIAWVVGDVVKKKIAVDLLGQVTPAPGEPGFYVKVTMREDVFSPTLHSDQAPIANP